MFCPQCGKPLQEMWSEEWYSSKGLVISIVARCEECDFDGTWDIDEKGNENNFKQYFFG